MQNFLCSAYKKILLLAPTHFQIFRNEEIQQVAMHMNGRLEVLLENGISVLLSTLMKEGKSSLFSTSIKWMKGNDLIDSNGALIPGKMEI